MFEKDAEKWWYNEYSPSLYDNVSKVWQKGAEFGYNKANEWHNLTKNPNDLPPADPMFPECSIQVFGTAKTPIHYNFTYKEWVSDLSYETVNPVAWYDIPDYEWEN